MSKLQCISAPQAPAAVGPYSHAVQAGPVLYLSGQLGMSPATGQLVGPDFESQVRQTLANIQAILSAAGYGVHDLASVDVFMTDLANFKLFNTIYEQFMDGHRPARAAIQVAALPLGAVVEIKGVAVRQDIP